jgi:hypothetical protein
MGADLGYYTCHRQALASNLLLAWTDQRRLSGRRVLPVVWHKILLAPAVTDSGAVKTQ